MSNLNSLHIPYKDLEILPGTKYYSVLSKSFLDMQNCWENLDKIKELFEWKYEIYEAMENTDDKDLLKLYAHMVTQNEFDIQVLFKFEPNPNYHRFWELPKCTCPKLDNQDRLGTISYLISTSCPIHGGNNVTRS